jgi:exopolyphosphatase/guanosine-5'-triphosphate,3'-diphosphate pyrophosphatase
VSPDQTFAALDLGTNSFHMVVARVGAGDRLDVLTTEKEMVRLGHGGGEMKLLAPDAIDRGIDVLTRMRLIADSQGATVVAVATSAVREAVNAAEFLRRARTEAGVDVEVISGVEEARLIHLGVLQAVPVFDRRILLVDIGGGSTEVLVGQQGRELAVRSFKLGAVRLTDRFFGGDRLRKADIEECRSYVRSALTVIEREVRELGFDLAVASSGTAEAVARMVHARSGEAPLLTYNCFEVGVAEMASVIDELLAARSVAARRRTAGLDAGRADIIVAGALILEGVARVFGAESFTYSGYALREGVLLDAVERLHGDASHHLRDVAGRSVRRLADRCDDDPAHSAHVAALALMLFDGTAEQHGLTARSREHLEAAALLANVGLVVSHSRHHLHSYYVIRHSELVGFTDREIEIVAQVARYHRKSAPKTSHPEFARLSDADQHEVRVLAGLLRIAIGLDRSHDRRVSEVQVHRRGTGLVVEAVPRDGSDLGLELYAANDRRSLLEEALGREIVVRAAPR